MKKCASPSLPLPSGEPPTREDHKVGYTAKRSQEHARMRGKTGRDAGKLCLIPFTLQNERVTESFKITVSSITFHLAWHPKKQYTANTYENNNFLYYAERLLQITEFHYLKRNCIIITATLKFSTHHFPVIKFLGYRAAFLLFRFSSIYETLYSY